MGEQLRRDYTCERYEDVGDVVDELIVAEF